MLKPNVFFLSYNEANAASNYKKLLNHCDAQHIAGITGIFNAHCACAMRSKSDWFYVVDADSVLIEQKDKKYFDFSLPANIKHENVYVWDALNPVNDLCYGYGGIKLFHRSRFINNLASYVDMTSSVAKIVEMKETVSMTFFNSSPFDSWKAGFRETCKLTRHCLEMPDTDDKRPWKKIAEDRVAMWMSKGFDREFGGFCIQGAKLGKQYAMKYDSIKAVNNFHWLESYFLHNNKGMSIER